MVAWAREREGRVAMASARVTSDPITLFSLRTDKPPTLRHARAITWNDKFSLGGHLILQAVAQAPRLFKPHRSRCAPESMTVADHPLCDPPVSEIKKKNRSKKEAGLFIGCHISSDPTAGIDPSRNPTSRTLLEAQSDGPESKCPRRFKFLHLSHNGM